VRLSPHFDSDEWRRPGDPPITAAAVRQLQALAVKYLEPLRSTFGPVIVSSGMRSIKHNAEVGGARSSYHLWLSGRRGVAADVVCRAARRAAGTSCSTT